MSTRVAFESQRDGDREIWLVNRDGSGLRQLTFNTAADGGPDWSPDGARIAFASRGASNPEILVIGADGSGLANVTNHNGTDRGPSWLPPRMKP